MEFLYGDVNTYTLAASGLPDGNELFVGLVADHQPITRITLFYSGAATNDEFGVDEFLCSVGTHALAGAVTSSLPESCSMGLLLVGAMALMGRRRRR